MENRQNNNTRFPFTAVVGQEEMKLALILNLIYPEIGGVLIVGEKGTAKSTIVRAMQNLQTGISVVELPLATTEDKLIGSIDVEQAIKTGEIVFEPGILHKAHRQILYVDEVNLLEDHLVDVLLDVAAMGVNYIERESISYSHPSRFVLVGTMNPEEGEIRPQLLDRFGLSVNVCGERDMDARTEILRRRLKYERDAQSFIQEYHQLETELAKRIELAKTLIPQVTFDEEHLEFIAEIGIKLKVDGHRADLTLLKTAIAIAAYNGESKLVESDILKAAELVLPHRMRRLPFDNQQFTGGDILEFINQI